MLCNFGRAARSIGTSSSLETVLAVEELITKDSFSFVSVVQVHSGCTTNIFLPKST